MRYRVLGATMVFGCLVCLALPSGAPNAGDVCQPGSGGSAEGFDSVSAAEGGLVWNSFLGGALRDDATGIAVDASGNVYVVGKSTTTWGTPRRRYTSGSDAYVARFSCTGALTWNTFLGGGSDDLGTGIAVGPGGRIYVAGQSRATWGSPRRPYTGTDDMFVAELAGDGSLIWNTFLGGPSVEDNSAVAVDGGGNIYVGGTTVEDWGSPVRPYSGQDDSFIAKLTSDGSLIWNTFLGGPGGDRGLGIEADGIGNVYVAGDSWGTWGSPRRPYTGYQDAFVAKLASNGTLIWNTFLGAFGNEVAHDPAVDGGGNVYLTGNSSYTWGSPVRAYTADTDAFVAKLSGSGILIWNTFLGAGPADAGNGITVDRRGEVYVTGSSGWTWGVPQRPFTALDDAFVAKLASNGTIRWNTFLGGAGPDRGHDLALAPSGNLSVAGSSYITWGSPVRRFSTDWEGFAAKLQASGVSIDSIVSQTSKAGKPAIICGSGFSPTTSGNAVYFGALAGAVKNATTTKLTVTIPTGCVGGKKYGVYVKVGSVKSNVVPFTVKE
ncbi:MAG: SBBP repeat-containing protein [Acidobacteriota bacterium]